MGQASPMFWLRAVRAESSGVDISGPHVMLVGSKEER